MLSATEEEMVRVAEYMQSQAPDLEVTFVQKVYSENVLHIRHDVWDVHTDKDRWWVITEPMNLYSQEQFPNMDLAVTFHVGLCLRIPRSDEEPISELHAEPLGEALRYLTEAQEALRHAEEVSDFQAVGVKCREAMLAYARVVQVVAPWHSEDPEPKKADFKAWANHVVAMALPGPSRKERRQLIRTLLHSAWDYANWLTHAQSTRWHDAEAAFSVTENSLGLCMSGLLMYLRGVPDNCPACGSHRLSPERGIRTDNPEQWWERPTCASCGWTGSPVRINEVPTPPRDDDRAPPAGECVIPTEPLRRLRRPGDA